MITNHTKCPDWDGNGVFMARALLSRFDSAGTVYSDTCSNENIGKEVKPPKKPESNNIFNLYPNPNNGGFTLSYTLQKGQSGEFIIYNLLGQKIEEDELNPAEQSINITARIISNGIYLYQINVNGMPAKKDKLIIIK